MKTRQKDFFIILQDQRLPVVKKLLESMMTLTDLRASIAYVSPKNILYVICMNSVIYSCTINECINDEGFYIDCDPTFDQVIVANTDPKIKTKTVKVSANKLAEDECIILTDHLKMYDFDQKIAAYVLNTNNYPIIYKEENIIKNGDSYNDLLSIKADDGAKFYKMNIGNTNFMYPVFTGFPNLSKADDFDISILGIDNNFSIMHLIIHKKKLNRDIHMIYRIINLV